jgi:hypothetical protein
MNFSLSDCPDTLTCALSHITDTHEPFGFINNFFFLIICNMYFALVDIASDFNFRLIYYIYNIYITRSHLIYTHACNFTFLFLFFFFLFVFIFQTLIIITRTLQSSVSHTFTYTCKMIINLFCFS